MSLDNPQPTQGIGSFGNQASANASQTDTTLSEALITLKKRRAVLILMVILGVLFGIYKALTQVKVYEAYGRIEVRAGSSNEFKVSAFTGGDDDPQRKMQTEIAIITSETLLALSRER